MDNIVKRSMNIKQIKVLAIVIICTILCHMLLAFLSENFPPLNFNFFAASDLKLSPLLCSAFLYLPITLLLKLFIAGLNENDESTFSKFLKEFDLKYLLVCALFCLLHLILSKIELSYDEYARCLFVTIYCGILSVVFISMVMGYDDVDFAMSQYDQCSIGSYWATGATQAYYEKSLEKFNDRLKNFEAANPNVKFFVKKLVLIAPLSCNIEGSLPDRDDEITHVGDLKPIECDQGANINRHLITPVYKIDKEIFIAAEFPSPLGTLWGERHRMDKDVRIYIRDCFLKELKEQLKPYPVIILEYDDQNPSGTVPLHHFIVTSLQNYMKENNYYL